MIFYPILYYPILSCSVIFNPARSVIVSSSEFCFGRWRLKLALDKTVANQIEIVRWDICIVLSPMPISQPNERLKRASRVKSKIKKSSFPNYFLLLMRFLSQLQLFAHCFSDLTLKKLQFFSFPPIYWQYFLLFEVYIKEATPNMTEATYPTSDIYHN